MKKRLDPDPHSLDFQVRLAWLMLQGKVEMECIPDLHLGYPDWRITCKDITARSCSLGQALDLVILEVEDVPR
jgi:hypothetical protein